MRRRNQAATGTEVIAWAVQRHVDFTDCKTSLLIMGDKSPKANQKHKAHQKARANSAAQKKEQQASAAKAAPRKK